ncbi:MAG: hypothetical protein Roseis2KO_53110 [Roseivirga sp.]
MKKLLVILFLGTVFSCQEALEPDVIIEEVASSALEEAEAPETEIEVIIECFEEVLIEEFELPTDQEIEDEILVDLEVEINDIEIVEVVEEIRQN